MAEREIKYRGLKTFQIFSGEMKSVWIYGFYLKRGTYGDPGPQAHIFVYENGYEGYRVDADTIGQFTGLTDIDGAEIYEDDIVSFENGRIGTVEFFHGSFVVKLINGNMQNLYESDNLKVLGNRFENPELLTVQRPVSKKKKSVDEKPGSRKLNEDYIFGK